MNSKEKENFISDLKIAIRNIDIPMILDKDALENIAHKYARILEMIWYKHLRCINITRWSKNWWNEKCYIKLRNYRSSKLIED